MDLLTIHYARSSELGPVVPYNKKFDFSARKNRIFFDLRCGRNQGVRCPGSLHQNTSQVCRVWDLKAIPSGHLEFRRQSTIAAVLRDDLDCLQTPKVPNKAREANTRAIHDLAWDCRHMLYKYFKVGYQQFFRVR